MATKNKTPNFPETRRILEKADVLVYMGGLHTPGKYLSAVPSQVEEVAGGFLKPFGGGVKILGGPAFMGSAHEGGVRGSVPASWLWRVPSSITSYTVTSRRSFTTF